LLKQVLHCFRSEGQKVSVSKTKVLFSRNVSDSLARNISRDCGFGRNEDLSKYLGIPLLHQRITRQTYGYLLENMQRKLASWKSNNISLAGRITLCKSALSTIPLYPMQSTVLPKGICMEID
jgi:hypothetical protein